MANGIVDSNPWGRSWTTIISLDTADTTGSAAVAAGTIVNLHGVLATVNTTGSGDQVQVDVQQPGTASAPVVVRLAPQLPGAGIASAYFNPPVKMNGLSATANDVTSAASVLVTLHYSMEGA